MTVVELVSGKFSFSISTSMIHFAREDGKDGSRQSVCVTIWEHMDTGRKYSHLLPVSSGYSFCQPTDDFKLKKGAKQATSRALDGLGISGQSPEGQAIHQAVKKYVTDNPWL